MSFLFCIFMGLVNLGTLCLSVSRIRAAWRALELAWGCPDSVHAPLHSLPSPREPLRLGLTETVFSLRRAPREGLEHSTYGMVSVPGLPHPEVLLLY